MLDPLAVATGGWLAGTTLAVVTEGYLSPGEIISVGSSGMAWETPRRLRADELPIVVAAFLAIRRRRLYALTRSLS